MNPAVVKATKLALEAAKHGADPADSVEGPEQAPPATITDKFRQNPTDPDKSRQHHKNLWKKESWSKGWAKLSRGNARIGC